VGFRFAGFFFAGLCFRFVPSRFPGFCFAPFASAGFCVAGLFRVDSRPTATSDLDCATLSGLAARTGVVETSPVLEAAGTGEAPASPVSATEASATEIVDRAARARALEVILRVAEAWLSILSIYFMGFSRSCQLAAPRRRDTVAS
jgi:hypothetical protein